MNWIGALFRYLTDPTERVSGMQVAKGAAVIARYMGEKVDKGVYREYYTFNQDGTFHIEIEVIPVDVSGRTGDLCNVAIKIYKNGAWVYVFEGQTFREPTRFNRGEWVKDFVRLTDTAYKVKADEDAAAERERAARFKRID